MDRNFNSNNDFMYFFEFCVFFFVRNFPTDLKKSTDILIRLDKFSCTLSCIITNVAQLLALYRHNTFISDCLRASWLPINIQI